MSDQSNREADDHLGDSLDDAWMCEVCTGYFVGYSNNGDPLVDGEVCDGCNHYVLLARMYPERIDRILEECGLQPTQGG